MTGQTNTSITNTKIYQVNSRTIYPNMQRTCGCSGVYGDAALSSIIKRAPINANQAILEHQRARQRHILSVSARFINYVKADINARDLSIQFK